MTPKHLLPPLAAIALLAGCAVPTAPAVPTASPEPTLTEVSAAHPRAVIAHDGGLTTIDTATGETVGTTALDGFLRLNDAGDGRHVLVTRGDEFLVFDAALSVEAHGDHSHYFAGDPRLTDVGYAAAKAGHVVVHDGHTVLFGDGDGSIQVVDSLQVARPGATVWRTSTDAPHHGVAVQLLDGSLLLTQGTEEARNTVQVKRGADVLAETEDCPGSHGEAAAEPTEGGDVFVIGCTTGPVIYRDATFHKVPVTDAYARTGNLAGSPDSSIVLADYKSDETAEHERPTRVALIDTVNDSLRLVDLGSSYWFRSLGRGPHGEGLVLTYDGSLQVIDPDTGEVTAKIPAIGAWEEKDDWQEPGPILRVAGGKAFVTDAEGAELVVIDLDGGKVVGRHALGITPVEMAIVTGEPAAGNDH